MVSLSHSSSLCLKSCLCLCPVSFQSTEVPPTNIQYSQFLHVSLSKHLLPTNLANELLWPLPRHWHHQELHPFFLSPISLYFSLSISPYLSHPKFKIWLENLILSISIFSYAHSPVLHHCPWLCQFFATSLLYQLSVQLSFQYHCNFFSPFHPSPCAPLFPLSFQEILHQPPCLKSCSPSTHVPMSARVTFL